MPFKRNGIEKFCLSNVVITKPQMIKRDKYFFYLYVYAEAPKPLFLYVKEVGGA